ERALVLPSLSHAEPAPRVPVVLACRIPWTEEPGRLQSRGSASVYLGSEKSTTKGEWNSEGKASPKELKAPLEEYVHKRYPGLVKVVRNQKREGLIRARIEGWKVATGQVTGFFDAHVEFTAGWAEPVLSRIQENRKRVILPSIDNIKQDTFEVQRYENSAHGYSWELWCMYISPPKDWWDAGDPSLPIRDPLGMELRWGKELLEDLRYSFSTNWEWGRWFQDYWSPLHLLCTLFLLLLPCDT
ncbi:hypothetical protein FD755_005778, partial [Muntiacus reevesi]